MAYAAMDGLGSRRCLRSLSAGLVRSLVPPLGAARLGQAMLWPQPYRSGQSVAHHRKQLAEWANSAEAYLSDLGRTPVVSRRFAAP
jgi:hypothetical protein